MTMREWRIAIIKDSSKPMLGLHALHVAFRGLPDVEVVAHVDSNADNLAEKMSYTQARRHYLTCRDMLENESPDIVVICSRHPDDHLPLIEAAAEKGCHVYCEKPLAATLPEADRIIEIAEKHRIKIGMAHPGRYALTFRTMKKMIDAGEIGTPVTVHGRGKCDHRGGGEDLVVLGTHILDLQNFFFGRPEFVFAEVTTGGRPIVRTDRSQTVEPIGPAASDRIFAYFGLPGGVRGIFESQKGLHDPSCGQTCMKITVHGTKGTLSMRFDDTRERRLRISRRPFAQEDDASYEEVPLTEDREIPGAAPLEYALSGKPDIPTAHLFLEAGRFAVWDLMRAIEEDRQPISSVYEARAVLEMIHGIYASHLAGRRVDFPLAERTHPLESPANRRHAYAGGH